MLNNVSTLITDSSPSVTAAGSAWPNATDYNQLRLSWLIIPIVSALDGMGKFNAATVFVS